MDFTAEVTGLVRRVSPDAHERLLLLFHYLLHCSPAIHNNPTASSSSALQSTVETKTTTSTTSIPSHAPSAPTLSASAIYAVLCYACPGVAPRFLFALGGNGTLLRSPDCGRSWRVSFARPSAEEATRSTTIERTAAAAVNDDDSAPSDLATLNSTTTTPALSSSSPVTSADGGMNVLLEMQRLLQAAAPTEEVAVEAAVEGSAMGGGSTTNTTAPADLEMRTSAAKGREMGGVEAKAKTSAAGSSEGGVSAADGYGDVVALCGPGGFLAVSADRGVTFTTATHYFTAHDAPATPFICVVHRHRLLVSDGARVVAVAVAEVGFGRLALGAVSTVLRCASSVVHLRAFTAAQGRRGVVVSVQDALHVSFDGGDTFLEVRHSLGTIREVQSMSPLRRCELPTPAAPLLAATLATDTAAEASRDAPPPPPTAGSATAASLYTYISGYERDLSSCDTSATRGTARHPMSSPIPSHSSNDEAQCSSEYYAAALTAFEQAARRHPSGVHVVDFFVSGCGAAVLPYDYTAVLTICSARLPDSADTAPPTHAAALRLRGRFRVMTGATRVSYVPFSHARRLSPLPCVLLRSGWKGGGVTGAKADHNSDNGGVVVTAVRGSGVGVSTSTDLEHWSTPHGAAPVGLVTMAATDVIACGRLKVLTAVVGDTAGPARTVPSELRVPYLLTAFAM